MTQHVEAEAFLAMLDGDEAGCRRLLAALVPNQLDQLRATLGQMRSITSETYRNSQRKGPAVDDVWF